VGDLFSALVLGHYKRNENGNEKGKGRPTAEETKTDLPALANAASRALLTVQQILLRTHMYALDVAAEGNATPLAESDPHTSAVIPSDAELDDAPPLNPNNPKRKARRMRLREMRVVPNRDLIVDGGEGWPGVKVDWSHFA
jgi:pyridoxine kinase